MQNKTKLVTVITLNYNNPFIVDSINSVLEQTYNYIQYIIVDDCSRNFNTNEISCYIDEHQPGNIVDKIIIKNSKNNLNKNPREEVLLWMLLSIRAANKLWAFSMALKSPVKWRLISSIGNTCE